jgi:tripartite ATP-independent transporter DctP family solute receptor
MMHEAAVQPQEPGLRLRGSAGPRAIEKKEEDMKLHIGLRYLLSLAAVALVGVTIPSPVSAQEFVMRLAHVVNPGSPRDKLMHLYGKNLTARTNGRIKVEVYPSGQLGGNRQIIEGLQIGTIEGTITPTAFLGGFDPLLTILDLPFLFPNIDVASNVANSAVGMELAREVEGKGIKGIAFYGEGAKVFATNFPVHKPADFQGKKIRSMPAPVLLEQFRTWGANPVPMEFTETYNALAQGVVAGQEQQWGLVHDLRFYEVSKYLTESNHGFFVEFFMVSKKWFDGLPKDLQDAVVSEAQKLIPVRLQWTKEYSKESLDKILATAKDVHYYKLTEQEWSAFRDASLPVQTKFAEVNGAKASQYLKRIKDEVQKAGK